MDRCIREVGSGDEQRDTIVDNMVQDALVASMLPVVIQDLFESGHMVVPGTQSRLTMPWVAAHLTDTLTMGGVIPKFAMDGISDGGSDESSDVSLRDYYVEMYACSLQRSGGADIGVITLALLVPTQCGTPSHARYADEGLGEPVHRAGHTKNCVHCKTSWPRTSRGRGLRGKISTLASTRARRAKSALVVALRGSFKVD